MYYIYYDTIMSELMILLVPMTCHCCFYIHIEGLLFIIILMAIYYVKYYYYHNNQ